jgi:hypothetical protein
VQKFCYELIESRKAKDSRCWIVLIFLNRFSSTFVHINCSAVVKLLPCDHEVIGSCPGNSIL